MTALGGVDRLTGGRAAYRISVPSAIIVLPDKPGPFTLFWPGFSLALTTSPLHGLNIVDVAKYENMGGCRCLPWGDKGHFI